MLFAKVKKAKADVKWNLEMAKVSLSSAKIRGEQLIEELEMDPVHAEKLRSDIRRIERTRNTLAVIGLVTVAAAPYVYYKALQK